MALDDDVREHPIVGKGMSMPKEEDVKNRRPDQELKHLAHNFIAKSPT